MGPETVFMRFYAITGHVNYVYPADKSATRWKEILHKKMNSKCRNQRALFKKEE